MAPIPLHAAMLALEGTGPVLEVALEVSRILREAGIQGAIIGGVAVSLHGYIRTTVDVDVYVESDADGLSTQLQANGFIFDPAAKQFVKHDVPVHIVTLAQLQTPPRRFEELHGMRTVALADLISMKLRSGTRSVLRAKDLGDAIGLIRHHQLGNDFTPQIDTSLRDEFRRIIDAIEHEGESRS